MTLLHFFVASLVMLVYCLVVVVVMGFVFLRVHLCEMLLVLYANLSPSWAVFPQLRGRIGILNEKRGRLEED